MMTSSKPYLIQALYDWINDNEMTPYIVVNSDYSGVQVPQDLTTDGKIVLNISPNATRGLHIAPDRIIFTTNFSGVANQIAIPPAAVGAIYAKENGRGMVFAQDQDSSLADTADTIEGKVKLKRAKPKLKVIK